MNRPAVHRALWSAVLFRAPTAAAKALPGTTSAAILAGLLHCCARTGIGVLRRTTRGTSATMARETGFARIDPPGEPIRTPHCQVPVRRSHPIFRTCNISNATEEKKQQFLLDFLDESADCP